MIALAAAMTGTMTETGETTAAGEEVRYMPTSAQTRSAEQINGEAIELMAEARRQLHAAGHVELIKRLETPHAKHFHGTRRERRKAAAEARKAL